MITYNNSTINTIIFNKLDIIVDVEYIDKINKLKELIKDIKFETKLDNNNNNNNNNRNRRYHSEQSFKKFEIIKNYQSKIINDKTLFTKIRNVLNKITEKTYEKLLIDLINLIQLIYDNNDENKDEITNFIFDFFTKNLFMSKIYSNIYTILCNKYDDFKIIILKNLEKFDNILNYLENNDKDNIDMDYFKSYFLFYSNCYNYKIIDLTITQKILINFQSKLINLINEIDKKEICENISELFFIFIKNSYNELKEKVEIATMNEKNQFIFNNIHNISNFKVYDYKSLSNKIIFKHKDLMDLFNK